VPGYKKPIFALAILTAMDAKMRKAVGIWLIIGVGMIMIQIVLGGITRLTESGLSITRWEVISGTLPPLNKAAWQEEFDAYKASPQYQKVNRGMSLEEFRQIFFWEWFHRLWGRLLGFVFLIPFIYFLVKGYLNKSLIRKAGVAFLLGGTVGIFGWLMVASGLQDRPMVSPYRLAGHLLLAILTISYLYWVGLQLLLPKEMKLEPASRKSMLRAAYVLLALLILQIFFGALVSGMRAAPFYPSWPDMNGSYIPDVLLQAKNYSLQNLFHFDQNAFAPAFVQFLHRNIAYLILIFALYFFRKSKQIDKDKTDRLIMSIFICLLMLQVILGILTLLSSIGHPPVVLGVIHQGVAILTLLSLLTLIYRLAPGSHYFQSSESP